MIGCGERSPSGQSALSLLEGTLYGLQTVFRDLSPAIERTRSKLAGLFTAL
jgi:hypothetical protein